MKGVQGGTLALAFFFKKRIKLKKKLMVLKIFSFTYTMHPRDKILGIVYVKDQLHLVREEYFETRFIKIYLDKYGGHAEVLKICKFYEFLIKTPLKKKKMYSFSSYGLQYDSNIILL